MWSVAPSGDRLMRGGRNRFLLADTLWAAFTHPTEEEWGDYVELRTRQGFTAVLVSALPIAHDRSDASIRSPFGMAAGGLDFALGDADYWDRAERMVEHAAQRGLTTALVLLWNNYVPGTWGARLTPDHVLDDGQSEEYIRATVDRFRRHAPIFLVSGDDDLDDEGALRRYESAARLVREHAPEAPLLWHSTPSARMPEHLAEGLADAYGYQSGHNEGWDTLPATLAEAARALPVRRPILNLEPCYEGLGRFRGRERHSRGDVRRASWTSILAGAGAGLGYGAHGVWSWHRRGAQFTADDVHGRPFPASVALGFGGARDVAVLARLVEEHDLFALEPAPGLVIGDVSGVRAARRDDGAVILYAPSPFPVTVSGAFSEVTTYRLDTGAPDSVRATTRVVSGSSVTEIDQPEFPGDALHVLRP